MKENLLSIVSLFSVREPTRTETIVFNRQAFIVFRSKLASDTVHAAKIRYPENGGSKTSLELLDFKNTTLRTKIIYFAIALGFQNKHYTPNQDYILKITVIILIVAVTADCFISLS